MVKTAQEPQPVEHRNIVLLVGRLAAAAQTRELPSGDTMVTFRLVVRRDDQPPVAARPRRVGVDTVDCMALRADVRRASAGWRPGDVLEVQGALRRRFWRGAGGLSSRSEVEVSKVRRVHRTT